MSGGARLGAVAVMTAGLVIAAFGLLVPIGYLGMGPGAMGGPGTVSSYSLGNVIVIMLGTFLFTAGIVYLAVRVEPEVRYVPPPVEPVTRAEPMPPGPEPTVLVEQSRLVLRLLTGDERTMFRALLESGGEALQKDLATRTKMSEAKVSRIIDQLKEKGLVTRERYGTTDKVRVSIEP